MGAVVDGIGRRLDEAVERTSGDRERHVDLVRAVAIALVVTGHWLAVAVTEVDGGVDGVNALRVLEWARPLTWVFQVMPVFFFIGGYANAASLAANRRDGGDALGWVLGRFLRILVPSAALLATLAAAVLGARLLEVDTDTITTAAWLATVPLWFLAAYLAVLVLAPLTEAAHRRWGALTVVALATVVVAADVARVGADREAVGVVNHVAAWALLHQLGYAWHDGRLRARPAVGAVLAVGGLAGAVAATRLGPYPTSMVDVPGAELQNAAPPTVALVLLGVAQVGVVLAVRDRSTRWLRRPGPWRAVVAVNSVVLSVFLWHLAAAVVAAGALYAGGLLPVVPVGSPEWLALRPVWLAACAGALVPLVAAAASLELRLPGARTGDRITSPSARWAGWVGAVVALAGLLDLALAGRAAHGPLGPPTESLVAVAVGLVLTSLAGRARS